MKLWHPLAGATIVTTFAGYLERARQDGRQSVSPGLELVSGAGHLVQAAADGKVIDLGCDRRGYGSFVKTDIGEGYEVVYAYLDAISVFIRQEVQAGQIIGVAGRPAKLGERRLHFEVRLNGTPLDPEPMLRAEAAAYKYRVWGLPVKGVDY